MPHEEEATIFELDGDQALEALQYSDETVVGGIKANVSSSNATSYFSGFMAYKIFKFHSNKLKTSVNECDQCSNSMLSGEVDFNIHLFTTFKEFNQNKISPNYGLKYCCRSFIDVVQELERIFLYFFSSFPNISNFTKSVTNFIHQQCFLPEFCNPMVTEFFIKSYVKCRLLQCVRLRSKILRKPKKDEKLKKLKHK